LRATRFHYYANKNSTELSLFQESMLRLTTLLLYLMELLSQMLKRDQSELTFRDGTPKRVLSISHHGSSSFFIYTQKGLSPKTTSHRHTVQAVLSLSPLQIVGLHEVVSFKGFPDSCHMASSILPLLIYETIEKAATDSLLLLYA